MILGVDPGGRRVGLALADESTGFARPLEVVDRRKADPVGRICELVGAHGVDLVVVGRPVGLSGEAGPAVEAQREFVAELRRRCPVEVREHDERLTTVIAERALRDSGARRDRRRELRDAVAAQVMLQGYLDSRR